MITGLQAVRAGIVLVAAGQTQGNPGLDLAGDGSWIQECTDWNQDQDCRQENGQGPLQKLAIDEENKIPVIPQL